MANDQRLYAVRLNYRNRAYRVRIYCLGRKTPHHAT
jgi:hypothetical protein